MASTHTAEPMPADPALIDDLVAANRILYNEGVVDGFGHVSVRHDKSQERFLLARSMAPGLVTAADIMQFGLDGEPIEPGSTPYLERFIHSEIYKVQPAVQAIVHSHSPAVIPFGVAAEAALRPIYHMSSFLGAGVPVFEIREAGGPATDMLIRNPALGAALAKALGGAAVGLLRGHGNVVVGGSLREVVFRAVYTEVNARLQADALRLGQGEVLFLNDQEAQQATETNRGQHGRPWELWKARALGIAQ
jgi:ribulose-5-phosphate 4-epimerase/fuculose-1-phosphate aldolase